MSGDKSVQDPSVESLLGQAADEFSERLSRGETPDIEEYTERYPQVAELIRQVFPALSMLKESPDSPSDTNVTPSETKCLGDFRILREIGRGGMGVVYEAEQLSLSRRVALKVLPFAAVLDQRQLKRFKNEAQAAAGLHYQNIVPVYGIGSARGVHYYAMQYIEGQTLAEVIRELRSIEGLDKPRDEVGKSTATEISVSLASGKLPDRPHFGEDADLTIGRASDAKQVSASDASRIAEAETSKSLKAEISTQPSTRSLAYFRSIAQLGIQVAEALDHAHQEGVVHRDVKPSNLILDADGKIWVTDFGLAQVETDAGLTMTGDVLGTLRYMSPEQAFGRRRLIDHRTDVYSLGVTLYELSTLEPAFPGNDRNDLSRRIDEANYRPPRAVNKEIPSDLQTIALTAMAREPSERYATAKELADDLRCFLEDRPIRATSPSIARRVTKWSRRHRALVTAVVVILVLALIGLTISTMLIGREHARTRRQRDIAYDNLYFANIRLAQQDWAAGHLGRMLELLDFHLPTAGEADRRGWEWYYLVALTQRSRATLHGHTDWVCSVAYSPDGQRLASAGADGTVTLWDASTGEIILKLGERKGTSSSFESADLALTLRDASATSAPVAWSPDGRRIASCSEGRLIKVWDVETGHEVVTLQGHEKRVWALVWSIDGTQLVSASREDRTIRLWDVSQGIPLLTLPHATGVFYGIAWSPERRWIALGGDHMGEIRIWEMATGREVQRIAAHGESVRSLAWSRDGKRLASASMDQTVKVWDSATWRPQLVLRAHRGPVNVVAWNKHGTRLATGGEDGMIKIWDAETGEELNCLRGHTAFVRSVDWAPDGHHLASASNDATVKFWDAVHAQDTLSITPAVRFAWSPDGRRLATVNPGMVPADSAVRHKVAEDEEVSAADPKHRSRTDAGGSIAIFNVDTGRELYRLADAHSDGGVEALAWSSDGRRLAMACTEGTVQVWQLEDRRCVMHVEAHDGEARSVAWSPDGHLLATAGTDELVKIWDLEQRRAVLVYHGHAASLGSVAWSPDGRRIASASWDQAVNVWDPVSGQDILQLQRHRSHIYYPDSQYSVAWSPDGKRLVAGGALGIVVMWDSASGRELFAFQGHTSHVRCVTFSPDASRLATGGEDRSIKIWDSRTGRELLTLEGYRETAIWPIMCLEWSPDGRRLASEASGTLKIWDASLGYESAR